MPTFRVTHYLDASSMSAEYVIEADTPEEAQEKAADLVRSQWDITSWLGASFEITLGDVVETDESPEEFDETSPLMRLEEIARKNQEILNEYNQAGREDDFRAADYDDYEKQSREELRQNLLLAFISLLKTGGFNPEEFQVEELKYGG